MWHLGYLLNGTRDSGVCRLWGDDLRDHGQLHQGRLLRRGLPGGLHPPEIGASDFETAEQLYIDPEVCIDCDACVEACPVDAIFPDFDLPEKHSYALEVNAEFFAELGTADRTAA